MLIHHLIWIRTGSVNCSDHLGWIRIASGGYGDLGIRKKRTNRCQSSYDVTSTSCFMGSVPGSG